MLDTMVASPSGMQLAFPILAARCAGLRARAGILCRESERLRARSQSIAFRFAAAQQGVGRLRRFGFDWEPAPARPAALPISGGAATEAVLRDYISTTCLAPGDPSLRNDEALLANGILDSLGIVRLAAFIEETFGVVVPDEALLPENFGTVRRVAALVERLEACKRHRLGDGEREANDAAAAGAARDPDAAAVGVNDGLR